MILSSTYQVVFRCNRSVLLWKTPYIVKKHASGIFSGCECGFLVSDLAIPTIGQICKKPIVLNSFLRSDLAIFTGNRLTLHQGHLLVVETEGFDTPFTE